MDFFSFHVEIALGFLKIIKSNTATHIPYLWLLLLLKLDRNRRTVTKNQEIFIGKIYSGFPRFPLTSFFCSGIQVRIPHDT